MSSERPVADSKRSRILPAVAVLLVLAVVAAAVLWSAYGGPEEMAAPPTPPLMVSVAAVTPQPNYTITRSFAGRIEARRRTRLGFELAGTIEAVEADEGDRVAEGSNLVRLDTARLAAERAELQAELAEAESRAGFADRELARRANAGEPAFSEQAIDEAATELETARATVGRIRAAIDRIDVDLHKSVLTAPFDAVVVERLVDDGDVVTPGTPALVLLEDGPPEVRIGLAGQALEGLASGQTRSVTVEGQSFDATVLTVVPDRDLGARTVDARLALETDWRAVNAGDLARLSIGEEVAGEGAWVPVSALTESVRGLFAVYIAVPAGEGDSEAQGESGADGARAAGHRLERREVEVLHQTAERAFVSGGLQDGALVVTEGVHRLVPDLRVRLAGDVGDTVATD
jgi:RND family efflux transporter MFP subunit